MAMNGDSRIAAPRATQPSTRSTANRMTRIGSGSLGWSCELSGGTWALFVFGSSTGGWTGDCGRAIVAGFCGCSAGMSRTGGVGSMVTQPYCAVSTSIQAEMSDPRISVTPPLDTSDGAKPNTTRAGKPSCLAMSAAVTAYCSWSPIIRWPVSSSVIRSAACPERLAG